LTWQNTAAPDRQAFCGCIARLPFPCLPKEDDMAVKILITRKVPQEKAREMLSLFREMRSLATSQPGYISGETLKSRDRQDVYLVISTWQGPEDWEKWLLSGQRQEIQAKMDSLLGGKTEYEMFNYGLLGS
jgi:heme-degrading monooxygenase HmoA